MINWAGDLGVLIDYRDNEPGSFLQRKETDGWQDYLVDAELVTAPVDIERLPPGKYLLRSHSEG
jgi:hypothetical protein